MDKFNVFSIGKVSKSEGQSFIVLDKKYIAALKGLKDFGYLQVIWWFDGCDNEQDRATLVEKKPYKKGPEELGVFALRSPERPNPIAVSNAAITYVDEEKGIIGIAYIDADDQSPVLDLKPYTPSIDKIAHPVVPDWCSHWPKCVEDSGSFDWAAEFNF